MGVTLFIVITLIAFVGAVICVFYATEPRRRRLEEQEFEQAAHARRLQETQQLLSAREQTLEQEAIRWKAAQVELQDEMARLRSARTELEGKIVSYQELQGENTILKQDLRNLDVHLRKIQLDVELQRRNQETLDQRAKDLGSRYLKDNVKWIGSSLNPSNFATCKQRLQDVIERCRGVGFPVPPDEQAALLENLREEFERVVRAAFEREEQARIKALIREEQLRQKEIDRELQRLEREREAIKAALEKALAEAENQHSSEVEHLKARLAEAEARSQRAISQAQLTKSGHVYVISNIGSFGEGVFKIGMTRRFEPMERVNELSSASVPFPFDVHMMISCNDAPTLENALHRKLHKLRINKANPRKEFFRADLEMIRQIVEEHHGKVEYVADAEALQYRQSLAMSDEDQEFIESVYGELDEEDTGAGVRSY